MNMKPSFFFLRGRDTQGVFFRPRCDRAMPDFVATDFDRIPPWSSMSGSTPDSNKVEYRRSGQRPRSPLRPATSMTQPSVEQEQDAGLVFPVQPATEPELQPSDPRPAFNPNPVPASSWDPALIQGARDAVVDRDDSRLEYGNSNDADHGAIFNAQRQFGLPVSTATTRRPMRGIQETAGTSILSVGTAAQIRGQRNRFIAEMETLIESDIKAYRENSRIVREIMREEVAKEVEKTRKPRDKGSPSSSAQASGKSPQRSF